MHSAHFFFYLLPANQETDTIPEQFIYVFLHLNYRPLKDIRSILHGIRKQLGSFYQFFGKTDKNKPAVLTLLLNLKKYSREYNGQRPFFQVITKGEALQSPGWIALAAAIVSVVSKEILFHYTRLVGKRCNSPAVIANAWHHRSDAFSSIGTAVGIGGAILLGESWRVLDPLAAVIVSFFIVQVAVKQLKACIDELLERSLPDDIEQEITQTVLSLDGVSQPHHLRTRRIGSHYAIDMHVRMDGSISLHEAHEKATAIEQKLLDTFGEDTYISIHVEPEK